MFSQKDLCVVSLGLSVFFGMASAAPSVPGQAYLAQQALGDILNRGSPIAGIDNGCSKSSKTCDWMARFPDSTKLVHMNLPGTHDTSTWNYSDTTQASLTRYTGQIPDASFFRCQEHSILQSLNEGVRVFDLRFAYNPGNDTIGFYHCKSFNAPSSLLTADNNTAAALLSPTTRMEDVFIGLYNWLDNHPTEAVLVSINHEGGTGTPDDSDLYTKLYNILNTPLAQKYWVQTNGTLGTLGQARGKLTLLQRWSYSKLPSDLTKRIGIPLDPGQWTDNGKAIELTYNVAKSQIAYIEDFYDVTSDLPLGSGASAYINAKFNAVTAHLTNATLTSLHPDQLYISFASAAAIVDSPPMTPEIFAKGNGTDVAGMNAMLLPWLRARKGKRFGVIMLDFYDSVPGLIEAVIGL